MFELVCLCISAMAFMLALFFSLPKAVKEKFSIKWVPGMVAALVLTLVFTSNAFAVDGTEIQWMIQISAILEKLPEYLNLLLGLLGAIIAIALIIPGDQPEKALQSVVDFLAKFSKKPKE